MDRLLLRVTEAADLAACSRTVAYDLVRSGEWAIIRIGRSRRVIAGSLEEWISRRAAVDGGSLDMQHGSDA
jgi:excisionase family DNA binding protein